MFFVFYSEFFDDLKIVKFHDGLIYVAYEEDFAETPNGNVINFRPIYFPDAFIKYNDLIGFL